MVLVIVVTFMVMLLFFALGVRTSRKNHRAPQRVVASERSRVVGLRCTLGEPGEGSGIHGDDSWDGGA